jgi:hypothetical protein
VEFATQSPGKLANIRAWYKENLDTAARLNAFILEPHRTQGDEMAYTWDVSHTDPELASML